MSAAVIWLSLWVSAAHAAEPSFSLLPDGTIEARVHVNASVEELRAVIRNPKARQDLSNDVYSIDVKTKGRCSRLATRTRGMFRPLSVLSVFCPTNRGFKESLVSSADFSHYEQEWRFTASDRGTDVVYRTHNVPNLPVSTAMLNRTTQKSVTELFGELELWVVAAR